MYVDLYIPTNINRSDTRFSILNIHMNLHSKKILDFINEKKVVTSSEAAKYLHVSWNTADRYLLELLLERKVERIKKEGVTLWMKGSGKST